MNDLVTNQKIDVVDFDGLKLFMFKNDSLYQKFIPKDRKRQSIDNYYRLVNENREYPAPTINYNNCDENSDPRSGLFVYFKHLIERNIQFTVFDIGSHVGDFAIKCGHFFRHAKKNIKVISFDPSPAGLLVPLNISINGLTEHNKHETSAVTEHNGYYVFNFQEGNSDSARLSFSKKMKFSEKVKFYWGSSLRFKFATASRLFTSAFKTAGKSFDIIVRGINISHYLKANEIEHNLFFKVDVEGYDETLIRNILPLKKDRLISFITELHVDPNSLAFLQEVSEHFYVFDLYYCPNPTRFKLIQPEGFKKFIDHDLKNRKFGYTDLFLLDRNTPDADMLINKLKQLKEKKGEIVL